MRRIGQLLNGTFPTELPSNDTLPPGFIGLELELEGRRFEEVQGWEMKNDGSLRGGVEYVFRGPQGGDQALQSILNMQEALRVNPPEPTFRCSTHIHTDVRDLPLDKLEFFLLAFLFNEGVMFDHCSLERRYSNFCTPYFRNTELPRRLTQVYKTFSGTEQERFNNLGNWPKYTSLNIAVTPRFGSVEFRGSHAMTTGEDMIALAQRMLHLRRLATSIEADNGLAFVERLSTMPLEEMFPSGLVTGYVRDEQLSDVCYANALLLAGNNFGETLSQSRDESFREAMRNLNQIHQNNADPSVRINQEIASRLCLNIQNSIRLSDLIKLYVALRNIRGVGNIQITDLILNRRQVGRGEVIAMLSRLGYSSLRGVNLPMDGWADEAPVPEVSFDEGETLWEAPEPVVEDDDEDDDE